MPNQDSTPNMGPYENQSAVRNPQSNEEVFLGSFSSIMLNNLGRYVICEFLVGTSNLVKKEGILYSGGINFITLYQPTEEHYVVCDLYSLKFATFVDTGKRPRGGVTRGQNPFIQINPKGGITSVNPQNNG